MNEQELEIPGFRIIELLGEGAMARVFLARDEALDRKVAIKVMNRSLANDPSFRDRFLAEAKDTAKFVHPSIVSIYSTGVVDENYYLVLEYLEAGTLKDRQKARLAHCAETGEQPGHLFEPEEALVLLAQMADALAYAHGKGVVHRDIKPANIMFRSDGRAVLSDFGIAKSITENRELTMAGYSVGTPAYMSPEQRLGAADIDGRSDIYSLGIVFFELLTGRKPNRAGSGTFADLRKELDADVPALPPDLEHLQPLLDRMLAPVPERRFQSARELVDAVEAYSRRAADVLGDETVIQRQPSRARGSQQASAWGRKRLLMVIGSLGMVAAIAAASAWLLSNNALPEPEPVDAATAEEIQTYLENAAMFIRNGMLISPPTTNAATMYQRVLELQANNPDASEGMEQIRKQVLDQIETQIEQGNTEEARWQIHEALQYFPGDRELADLRRQIGQ